MFTIVQKYIVLQNKKLNKQITKHIFKNWIYSSILK